MPGYPGDKLPCLFLPADRYESWPQQEFIGFMAGVGRCMESRDTSYSTYAYLSLQTVTLWMWVFVSAYYIKEILK